MSENKTNRIVWIDVTKAAAAWMVVTAHLLRQGAVADGLAAVSVAVFFLLAGVTLHAHTDRRAYVRRLLQRIVLPYGIVGLVSIAAYRLLGSYAAASLHGAVTETTLAEDLWHLVYGSSVHGWMKWNESLWFLPCYCVMIVLAEGIEQVSVGRSQLRVVLYLAGGAVGCALLESGHIGLPWHLETALFVLPLCGLGRYLRLTLGVGRMRPWFALLFGAGLLCYGMELYPGVLSAAGGSLSLRAPQLPGIGTVYLFLLVPGLGVIYLLWFCAQALPLPAWVLSVGEQSLDIVLWNKFPVLFVQVVVPVLLPGAAAWFVGGTDGQALAAAAALAIPCIGLCLGWTWLVRRVVSFL